MRFAPCLHPDGLEGNPHGFAPVRARGVCERPNPGNGRRHIPTLADYLLVVPDEPRVLHYSLNGDHWAFRSIMGLGSGVYFLSVETTLLLADIYPLIEFGES